MISAPAYSSWCRVALVAGTVANCGLAPHFDTVWLQPCVLSPGADGQPVQGGAGAPLSAGQCRVLEAGRASPRPPPVRPQARPRPLDAARKDLFDHILIILSVRKRVCSIQIVDMRIKHLIISNLFP